MQTDNRAASSLGSRKIKLQAWWWAGAFCQSNFLERSINRPTRGATTGYQGSLMVPYDAEKENIRQARLG